MKICLIYMDILNEKEIYEAHNNKGLFLEDLEIKAHSFLLEMVPDE